jgi:uncharacterized protein YcbK (DUF882 family)
MKYFKTHEFKCHCNRGILCDAVAMNEEFLELLDKLREEWGRPLSPTSAQRCQWSNKKVGGAPLSQHLLGRAADFVFKHPVEARDFAYLAEKVGFTGIGLGEHLVHIDNRKIKARWFYHA